jgi:hypothetical protein
MNTVIETTTFHCPYCEEPLPEGATECTKCDWVRPEPEPPNAWEQRNPRNVAAAVLSVIPGAGHYFKGYHLPGVLLLAGVPVIVVFAVAFTMFFGWFLIPTYWVAVMADAYIRKDLAMTPGGTPMPH